MTTASPPVKRLFDILVEEVSLVDRAANQRRFLIVKRSNEMDETKQDKDTDQTTTDQEAGSNSAAATGEPSGESTGTRPETQSAPASGSLLAQAVEALEQLTVAVELLGSVEDAASDKRVESLAAELKAVADGLVDAVSGKSSGTTSNVDVTPSNDTAGAAQGDTTGGLSEIIDAARAALQRAAALVDVGSRQVEQRKAQIPAASATTTSADVAEQLAAVAQSLTALKDTVKAQQQRLTRLEKHAGLPTSSAPTGKREAPPREESVSWPLDINRDLDRQSVDETVSFHDV